MLLQQTLNGLSTGVVYALLAAGFSLTFATTRVVNFAFGELFTLGAFIGLVLQEDWHAPYGLAFAGASAAMSLTGLILSWWLFKVLRSDFDRSISTIIIALILRDSLLIGFGSDTRSFGAVFPTGGVHIGDAVLPYSFCILVGVGGTLLGALWWLLSGTRVGLWMQATAQNMPLAASLGVPVPYVQTFAVATSTGLLGAAAVLVSPTWQVNYAVGGLVAVKAFTAALLGGLGDLRGAVLGGLLLGLTEAFVGAYVSTAWKDAGVFMALAVSLLWLPRGIVRSNSMRIG